MKNGNHRGYSEPKCWWCGADLPLDNEWRGSDDSLGLPIEVGVHVCGPDCPEKPEEDLVYTHAILLRG